MGNYKFFEKYMIGVKLGLVVAEIILMILPKDFMLL
jgi:hypothetical protein